MQSRIIIIERAVMSSSSRRSPRWPWLSVTAMNVHPSPEKFQEFLDYLVNAYHRHFYFQLQRMENSKIDASFAREAFQ